MATTPQIPRDSAGRPLDDRGTPILPGATVAVVSQGWGTALWMQTGTVISTGPKRAELQFASHNGTWRVHMIHLRVVDPVTHKPVRRRAAP